MNFNFGEVLSRAWQIIWKHKILWVFGILAGCGRGGARFNSNSGGGGDGGGFGQPNFPPEVMRVFQVIQENLTTFIVVGCIVLLLIWAVTIFLGTIGRVGLIRGTFQADGGAENLIFGQLFSESTPYFWRMFGLSLLVGLPMVVLIAVIVAVTVAFVISAGGDSNATNIGLLGMLPLLIGCFCLLIPVMFVVGMIVRQAENAIVLEDQRVLPALSRGWDVFRSNLGPIILMAIILAVINLVVGFVIALPVLIVVVPAVITFAAGQAQNWTPMIVMGICLCLYIPVSLVLNGIAASYVEATWTLTYMRLTKPQDNVPVILEANA
ncbi:MAG: hypothetical protein EHM33_24595 [Chloroflexi bacterium]|nr:MAG: hypothetical protein EHM33_24595 [Chloroflexota bacterium]